MCLTIPAQVLRINNKVAEIKEGKQIKKINLGFVSDLQAGDWILHTVGTVVRKINSQEAKEIVELLEIARFFSEKTSRKFERILRKAQQNQSLLRGEIKYLLETEGDEKEMLYSEANITRQANLRDFFCIHGIIEFSNYCKNDCFYCGLRCENKNLKRYRMTIDEIVNAASQAVNLKGYKLLVLQSGEDFFYSDEMLCKIIRKIKEKCRVFIFMSVGERGYDAYKKMKEVGASGVLFRFETSNSKIFKRLHPKGKNLEKRLDHLKFFKKLGFFIATGSLIGLPGQKINALVDDILLTKKYAHMVSMGPFLPTEDTPLAKALDDEQTKRWKIEMNLKMIAVLRLLMPTVRIPVVTALETLAGADIRKKALQSGANSLMFNLTPAKYRPHYKIYGNKFYQKENVWEKYGLFKDKESYRMLEERMAKEIND